MLLKKDAEGAKKIIAGQKKDLEDSLDKMLANLQQVTDILANLQGQAQQIQAAAQGGVTGY